MELRATKTIGHLRKGKIYRILGTGCAGANRVKVHYISHPVCKYPTPYSTHYFEEVKEVKRDEHQ